MRIAFDFHGVLEKYPDVFAPLMQSLRAMCADVVVLSGPTFQEIKRELFGAGYTLGINYNVIYSVTDFLQKSGAKMWHDDQLGWWASDEDWWSAKARICEQEDIDLMIDDSEKYQPYFTGKTKFVLFKDCNFKDMLDGILKAFEKADHQLIEPVKDEEQIIVREDGNKVIRKKYNGYAVEKVLSKVLFMAKSHGKDCRVDFDGDLINMASDRYKVFKKKGIKCAECGIEGNRFFKERNIQAKYYHFNLYHIDENGKEMLMTKDHIFPKSLGGEDVMGNYQTMCQECNYKKGNTIVDEKH